MGLDPDKIDGIIWDLDNTLYRFTEEFRYQCNVAAAKAAQTQGINLSYDDTFKLAQKSEAEYGYSIHLYLVHHGLSYDSLHVPFHDNIDETTINIIDGAAEGIRAINRPQAILTNASRGWAQRVLKHMKVSDLFPDEMITASEDVDFQVKSQSRVGFERALKALDLSAERVVMVDDLDRNLIIPHEMGMQTVYMHHDDPIGDLPHYMDAQFENILGFIDALKA
jgi:putative hydrolase of the HAD superfamily